MSAATPRVMPSTDTPEMKEMKPLRRAERLARVPGVSVLNHAFFNEFAVVLPGDAREAVRAMADIGVLGGVSLGRLYPDEAGLAHGLLVTATECTTDEDIEALAVTLEGVLA